MCRNIKTLFNFEPPASDDEVSAAALQFELELAHLDQLDQFRERGVGTSEETGNWMRGFSEILVSPPLVEILRVEETQEAT